MFWEKVELLCNKKKVRPNPFLTPLGISSSSLTRWKKGQTVTNKELIIVADAFDCSIDYLLGRTDNPQSHHDISVLSDNEKALIATFRALNDNGKEMLQSQANLLASSPDYGKEKQTN